MRCWCRALGNEKVLSKDVGNAIQRKSINKRLEQKKQISLTCQTFIKISNSMRIFCYLSNTLLRPLE